MFSEKSFVNIWGFINTATQELVKHKLFECLRSEDKANVRKLIADAIGEIGGTLLNEEPSQWPELINLVWGQFM
jgi:hypothetical protein